MSLKLCAQVGTPTYPKKEQITLEELKQEDIVIMNAVEGGAVVTLDLREYIEDLKDIK